MSYDFFLALAELQNLETRRQLQSYDLRGSGTRLMLPSFNLECMHKSWSYLTTKLWNGLPTRVRECPDLAAFRHALHSLWRSLNFAGS